MRSSMDDADALAGPTLLVAGGDLAAVQAAQARLAALGAEGREHVAARYPVAAMLDAYEAVYRELSGGRGR